jgi:hypothetical protein
MPVKNLIQNRRGTAAQWVSANPVLSAGEAGFETDTGKFKWGNGTTAWNSLPYAASQPGHTHEKTDITDFAHTHVIADIVDYEEPVIPPSTILSDTAPEDPEEGTRWINTTNFIEYIFYDSYWVEV